MMQLHDKDKTYIHDIIECCENCIEFVRGMIFLQFDKDQKTISAVSHQIMIIGEAAKNLSNDFKNRHTEIPWKAMAGMRDVLIHAYQGADNQEIWNTVQKDIPELLKKLQLLKLI